MNVIEEFVMGYKSKRVDKEELYNEYLDCILTKKEFNEIYNDEKLYKEYQKIYRED